MKLAPIIILDPETHVSARSLCAEGIHRRRTASSWKPNPDYVGPRTPWLRRLEWVYGDQLNGSFLAYQDHQIDQVSYGVLSPADFDVIYSDPMLAENYRQHAGDFRTDYLLFDTFTEPFNDVNVRMAFAKAIDRESIVENVIGTTVGLPGLLFLGAWLPSRQQRRSERHPRL